MSVKLFSLSTPQLVLTLAALELLKEKLPECDGDLEAVARLLKNVVSYDPPITLDWKHNPVFGEYTARVPARDHVGEGHYIIHAIQRPGYCDRGKFHVLVESEGVASLDDQEGFPRYYFRLENLFDEMEAWANEREAVKEALKS